MRPLGKEDIKLHIQNKYFAYIYQFKYIFLEKKLTIRVTLWANGLSPIVRHYGKCLKMFCLQLKGGA